MENPLENALVKALNISSEELHTLVKNEDGEYKADAADIIVGRFGEHLNGLKETLKGQYETSKENLLKKNTKEVSERFERDFEAKFRVKPTEGESIVDAVFNVANSWKGEGLDEEKVKSHPYVLGLQADFEEKRKADIEKATAEHVQKYNELQVQIQREKVQSRLDAIADEFWSKQQVIDVDPNVKANWKKEFYNRVRNSANFKLLEDGRVIPVDDEGRTLVDKLQHNITVESLVEKSFTGYVPTKAASDRGSSGASGSGGSGSGAGTYSGAMPKNQDELNKMMSDPSVKPEHLQQIIDYCEKNNIIS